MSKTKFIYNKIIQSSMMIGWKLENREVKVAALASQIIDACRIQFLIIEQKLVEDHGKWGIYFSPDDESELQHLLEQYEIKLEEADIDTGMKLFDDAWHDLPELIKEKGEDEEFVSLEAKEKLKAIISFYPEYSWLKRHFLDVKGGKLLFKESTMKTQKAFEQAKIQGRFTWNIPTKPGSDE